ncbi:MAG: 50S ribosomal protein L10 [Thermoplasmata archaeon]|nr:50S ribosomal protein L10 [Thermoplasmata archaeon]
MAHVAAWKKEKVAELTQRIIESPVVGLVAVDGIPAPQLQDMRRKLRKESPIVVSKNNLIRLALTEAAKQKPGVDSLMDLIGTSQSGLLFSHKNPFKIYQELKASESKAPAKGGEVAPEDIMIKAGETPFKPGPIVGELQRVGIPAAIEGGKVVIKKDKLLVKAGERIPRDIAGALTRLEIYPLTVGLKLKGAFEKGILFKEDVLAVDPQEYVSSVQGAAVGAFNIAMHLGYATSLTIRPLLSKAHMEALNLAVNAGVVNRETAELIISKAYGQMLSLASALSGSEGALDEELTGLLNAQGPPPSQQPPPSAGGDEGAGGGEAEKEEEEKEEVTEEEAAAGLGALFG